jgi:hypothetical protein
MMWYLDCFVEDELDFPVNSYKYEILEKAILAARDVLSRKITGIYAVDIYCDDAIKRRRFFNAAELKLFFTFL